MARTTSPEKPKTKDTVTVDDPRVQLGKFLKTNEADHYNFEPDIFYTVSTGSLALDLETGGLSSGVHRLVGPPGCGKSNEALEIARHFLATVTPSRVVYVKSEGRLTQGTMDRSGLAFTKDYEQWTDHTVFVMESNIYEAIIDLFRSLIVNNPSGHRYLFIVDSADAINLRNDVNKPIEEGIKVAGAPLLTKRFLQKCALAMAKRGHMCLFLGQQSADIKIDPYAPSMPRQVKGSGGHAVAHFANQVLEFQNWNEGDLILTDPTARIDRVKNRPLGHVVRIKLQKSDKETRYITVEIPIRHDQVGGKSIWREREVGDLLLAWGLVAKAGSWLTLTPTFVSETEKQGITSLPEKVQGMNQLYALLDERKDLTDYLFAKFKAMVEGQPKAS